jgi:hypothetical protein
MLRPASQRCGDDFPDLRAIGQPGEFGVTERRAQLDPLHADVGELFQQAGKVLFDHRAVRPGLAADGQSERIGA